MSRAAVPDTIEPMSAVTVANVVAGMSLGRALPVHATRSPTTPRVVAMPLETLSARWRGALDAADRANRAAAGQLSPAEMVDLGKRLRDERAATARLLESVARARGSSDPFVHLMVPRSQLKSLLGLPAPVAACLFDLDALLVGSATAHASAWTETFDELTASWPIRAGESVASFDPRIDYPLHMHGRPRLEGIRAFLASRGIRLPEGGAGDRAGTESIHGLANRKQQLLVRYLDEHGMSAFAGARRYLNLVRESGVRCAVISASVNARMMLSRAGLAAAADVVLDGNAFVECGIRPKPSSDSLLAACERLEVPAESAAAFETTPAGVTAARRAAVALVVAIDRSARTRTLPAEGANIVVADLGDLLMSERERYR